MKSLLLIRNAVSITKTHSHSRAFGGSGKLCLVVVVWPEKKISENRICFGICNSNAVFFLEIGLVSSLKGYFHLAHQLLLRFFLSVACSMLKKYYGL